MYMSVLWLVVMVLFVIAEAATSGLVCIWFAFGSLSAMLAAILDAEIWLQIVVFIAASGLVLAFIRPFAKKCLKVGKEKTNADRVVSMEGVVTETIDNDLSCGQVKVNGQIWSARSADGVRIDASEKIRVISISGVKVIVERL